MGISFAAAPYSELLACHLAYYRIGQQTHLRYEKDITQFPIKVESRVQHKLTSSFLNFTLTKTYKDS